MPLKDLLWACPLCHQLESLDLAGVCRACHARFRRGSGARIIARAADPASRRNREADGRERTAIEWLSQLPWPDLDGEGLALPDAVAPPFEQPATARTAGAELPLRRAGMFLGHVERFGEAVEGVLQLDAARIGFTAQRDRVGRRAAGEGGPGDWEWPLTELTAIQPASSAIQLKARGAPVVSLRFERGSVRLWEQRLKYCTRQAFRTAGRGEIMEFQPRIRCR